MALKPLFYFILFIFSSVVKAFVSRKVRASFPGPRGPLERDEVSRAILGIHRKFTSSYILLPLPRSPLYNFIGYKL